MVDNSIRYAMLTISVVTVCHHIKLLQYYLVIFLKLYFSSRVTIFSVYNFYVPIHSSFVISPGAWELKMGCLILSRSRWSHCSLTWQSVLEGGSKAVSRVRLPPCMSHFHQEGSSLPGPLTYALLHLLPELGSWTVTGKGEKPTMHHPSESGSWHPNRASFGGEKGMDAELLVSNICH